jgi:polysaccharide biosynthesis/export protein
MSCFAVKVRADTKRGDEHTLGVTLWCPLPGQGRLSRGICAAGLELSLDRCLTTIVFVAALAGCSGLPHSGPHYRSIAAQATVGVRPSDEAQRLDYVLIELSKDLLPYFNDTVVSSLRDGFGTGEGRAPDPMLGVGDVVAVTIFEAVTNTGGLFVPLESGRTANFVTLPEQAIDENGNITIPYAGSIRLAGRSIGEVQREIEGRLANKAIEPQVIIATTLSRSSKLSILGDVNTPSELDVNPRGERVLDVLARAGGLRAPGLETYVTVERDGRRATALFSTIVENPDENIFVRSGDTIYVNRERRTYLVFGASGAQGQFDFEEFSLSLGEALAKAGGLLDSRANPSHVFLYRLVERETLDRIGVDVSAFNTKYVPVVFRVNFADPSMLFAAQGFVMQDKDIVYVSNAPSVELSKVLDIFNNVSNTSSNLPGNLVKTTDAIEDLGN